MLAHSQPLQKTTIYSGITEIVVPRFLDNKNIVLSLLAHMSQQENNKWLSWISETPIVKTQLEDYHFNLSNIRIIYSESTEQTHELLNKLLSNGNSHTVVADTPKPPEKKLCELEYSAKTGQSQGLLICRR